MARRLVNQWSALMKSHYLCLNWMPGESELMKLYSSYSLDSFRLIIRLPCRLYYICHKHNNLKVRSSWRWGHWFLCYVSGRLKQLLISIGRVANIPLATASTMRHWALEYCDWIYSVCRLLIRQSNPIRFTGFYDGLLNVIKFWAFSLCLSLTHSLSLSFSLWTLM